MSRLISVQPNLHFVYSHWTVVIAALTSILVFCAITPLSGAVFEIRETTHTVNATVTHMVNVLSLADQSEALNAGFMINAYSTLWLNQALPNFTTVQAAFLPFDVHQGTKTPFFRSNWTAQTTMYSSSLDCQAATLGVNSHGTTYEDGNGCIIEDGVISSMIPNTTSIFSSFNQTGCSRTNLTSSTFLAFSFRNSPPLNNMKSLNNYPSEFPRSERYFPPWSYYWGKTVLFCEPSYRIQLVNATLAVPNMAISDMEPLAPS